MSEKKRKRQDAKDNDKPRKKLAVEASPQTVKVSVIDDGDAWTPILASAPGLNLPSTLKAKPYTKPRASSSRSSIPGPELLLHSSAHPKLDYTAYEEPSNGSEDYLSHYIGVYDPESGKLELVASRCVVVRSTLRSDGSKAGQEDVNKEAPNTLSARSNLGLAFGTKKSQKAIRSLTANAIQASPSKSKTQSSSDKMRQLDPVASAVVSSMAESTANMPTRDEQQAEIDAGKPRPKPNLRATTPAEVYSLDQLVGGANVLGAMAVKDWIDTIKDGGAVDLKSRFVAKRLPALVQSGDVKKVKALKYLYLLIQWFTGLKPGPKSGRKVPKLEDMGALVGIYGAETVSRVGRRFSETIEVNKWHIDNIVTHILALAISLHNFAIDTHDIREDLKLESKDIGKYFAELGCVVNPPTDAERTVLKVSKAEASSHRMAKLKLPLTFPKTRAPVAKRR